MELLVVLVLVSLVMLGLASTLSGTAQTGERIDARLARADELRVASDFLHEVLGRVSGRKVSMSRDEGSSEYFFAGNAQAMQWLGIMPARHGAGGRDHFRLAVEDVAGASALVVRFTPWVADTVAPDWSQAESYVLVPQLRSLELSYQSVLAEPPVWMAQWADARQLPDRVMVSIDTASGAWPAIVVPMRANPRTDPRGLRAVFGGTR